MSSLPSQVEPTESHRIAPQSGVGGLWLHAPACRASGSGGRYACGRHETDIAKFARRL